MPPGDLLKPFAIINRISHWAQVSSDRVDTTPYTKEDIAPPSTICLRAGYNT